MYYKFSILIEDRYWAEGIICLSIKEEKVKFEGYMSNDIIKGMYDSNSQKWHVDMYEYDACAGMGKSYHIALTSFEELLEIPNEGIFLQYDNSEKKLAFFKIERKVIVDPEEYERVMKRVKKYHIL